MAGGDGETQIDGYVQVVSDPAKIAKALEREAVAGPLGPGIIGLEDIGSALYVYPNDAELPVLDRLTDDDQRRRLLERVLPNHEHLWDGTLERLSYKPERRRVVRLRGPSGSAVLRFHGAADFIAATGSAKRFQSHGDLCVATWLRSSTRHNITALEWIDGKRLGDVLATGEDPKAVGARVGAALAALHQQRPRLVKHRPAKRGASLDRSAASALLLLPSLQSRLQPLLARVRAGFKPAFRRRALHGDLAPDQVVLREHGVALLDLDRAGFGDPRVDAGAFIAALERLAYSGGLEQTVVERSTEGLLSGYAEASGLDLRPGLGVFVAAGFILALSEPFRTRQPDWPAHMEAMLDRATDHVEHRAGVD